MAVPSGNNHLKNTANGTFTAATEGGTVLGNTTTTAGVITKALALKDNATDFNDGTLPKAKNNGLHGTQKALSGGTFAYSEAGNYVIASSSATLSGVASTKLLITGKESGLSIAQFEHDYGANTTSLIRANRFSRVGFLNNGTKLKNRRLFLNAAGTAAAEPTSLNGNMFDPVAGSTASHSDSAANPTRAIPGELVMKVDFVTTSVASGGDFFDYAAITGV
jgi:hypothetical protein